MWINAFLANYLSDEKFEKALLMLAEGASVRETMRECDIANNTAHNIQKDLRKGAIEFKQNMPINKGGYWKQKRNLKR